METRTFWIRTPRLVRGREPGRQRTVSLVRAVSVPVSVRRCADRDAPVAALVPRRDFADVPYRKADGEWFAPLPRDTGTGIMDESAFSELVRSDDDLPRFLNPFQSASYDREGSAAGKTNRLADLGPSELKEVEDDGLGEAMALADRTASGLLLVDGEVWRRIPPPHLALVPFASRDGKSYPPHALTVAPFWSRRGLDAPQLIPGSLRLPVDAGDEIREALDRLGKSAPFRDPPASVSPGTPSPFGEATLVEDLGRLVEAASALPSFGQLSPASMRTWNALRKAGSTAQAETALRILCAERGPFSSALSIGSAPFLALMDVRRPDDELAIATL